MESTTETTTATNERGHPAPGPQAPRVTMVPLGAIVASPSNPREEFSDTYLQELGESMLARLAQGLSPLIHPLLVRVVKTETREVYEIVAGECRWRAAGRCKLAELPCSIEELSDMQVREAQAVENLQRRDVTAIEEGRSYQHLLDVGYTVKQIHETTGKSTRQIQTRLQLTKAPPALRNALTAGELTDSQVLLFLRIPSDAKRLEALEEYRKEVIDGGRMTTTETEEFVHRHFTISLREAPFNVKDATLLPGAGACGDCPKREKGKGGAVGGADVCTDTTCYQAKATAAAEHKLQSYLKKGHKMLPPQEVAAIFPNRQTWLNPSSKYADLDGTAPEYDDGRKTLRQVLAACGEKPKGVVVCFDGDGRVRELVAKDGLAQLLKRAGVVSRREEYSRKIRVENEKAARAAAALQRAIRTCVDRVISGKKVSTSAAAAWRVLALGTFHWHLVAANRKVNLDTLRAEAKKMPEAELRGLVFEAAITPASHVDAHSDDALLAGCALCGVDLKQVLQEVKQEERSKKAAAKPAAAKPTAAKPTAAKPAAAKPAAAKVPA